MRFRHSLLIAIDNFTTTFKLFLYRFLVGIVLGSVTYVILTLGLSAIMRSPEAARISELVGGFFSALLTGETQVLQSFQADFHQALSDMLLLIAGNSASIIGCAVGVLFIYLLTRFVNGLAIFSVGNVIGERMSTYSRTTFARAYFRRIGKAALYQVIYVPLSFLYDIITLLACWFFFFYAPSFLPSWGFITIMLAISLSMLAYISLQALKMTFISAWIPAIVADGMSVTAAMRLSFRSVKGTIKRFGGYLVLLYIIAVFNAVFAVFTMGSALFVTVPFSFILLLCMQFVNYFNAQGKRYFVSRHRIEGDSEDVLEQS